MASLLPSPVPDGPLAALWYSDQFDFPLTLSELWFWQVSTTYSKSRVAGLIAPSSLPIQNYYCLPRRHQLVSHRRLRFQYSQKKLAIAREVGESLKRFFTIQAVFLTGSLAMNNCRKYDDIDLMLVTIPHTLWLTRFFLYLYLRFHSLRRSPSLPEHSSPRVSGKICDNLYLDANYLNFTLSPQATPTQRLYLAHEILQAQPLWDRAHIRRQLLLENPWVEKCLPIAYRKTLSQSQGRGLGKFTSNWTRRFSTWLLSPFNLTLFFFQYFYMRPRITTERVSLHTAFFHPHSVSGQV